MLLDFDLDFTFFRCGDYSPFVSLALLEVFLCLECFYLSEVWELDFFLRMGSCLIWLCIMSVLGVFGTCKFLWSEITFLCIQKNISIIMPILTSRKSWTGIYNHSERLEFYSRIRLFCLCGQQHRMWFIIIIDSKDHS